MALALELLNESAFAAARRSYSDKAVAAVRVCVRERVRERERERERERVRERERERERACVCACVYVVRYGKAMHLMLVRDVYSDKSVQERCIF